MHGDVEKRGNGMTGNGGWRVVQGRIRRERLSKRPGHTPGCEVRMEEHMYLCIDNIK